MTNSSNQPKVLIAAGKGHITEVEMIKGLLREGVDIHAAFASTSPHLEALREGGVPTRTLNLKSNADFRAALKIRHWIKKEGFDIVHGLANRQVSNFIWASYGLPNKVIAYRGAIGHVSRWDPTCYLKWLNPRIDKIICVSKAVERDLAASGVAPAKLVTIHKGHDLAWYQHIEPVKAREKVNAEFGIPSDAILIGMAANMRRIKGADLLLKALMQLPKNVHGLFIGSVLDSEISILASDPKLSDRVHLTGFRKDAIEMIAALDINVAPSRGREGLTKSVIEASALKIPSICSNAGGLPETQPAGNHETIFSNGDVTRLKELLHTLIGNSELRKQLGSSSQKHTRENLSVEITIKRTETIYHEITSKT